MSRIRPQHYLVPAHVRDEIVDEAIGLVVMSSKPIRSEEHLQGAIWASVGRSGYKPSGDTRHSSPTSGTHSSTPTPARVGASRRHSTRLPWTQGRRVVRLIPEAHNRQRPAVVHRRLVTLQRVELQRRIAEGAGEFLLFALTPPRLTTEPEQASQIAAKTLERLRSVGLDGLVLYDIDDESDRNPEERPFPFLPTMDPADYVARDLVGLEVPAIVYRAVSKYPEQRLRSWLSEQAPTQALSVFVGASSREKVVATSLLRAYELRSEVRPDLLLGGVAIPERHARGGTEHLRLLAKQAAGCSFFVTQIVYDVNAAKDLVSDYHYECAARDLKPAPIVFTFSVCGSVKTLEFVQWLGVDVPRWIENELRHADDTLDASYDQAVATAVEVIAFCRRVGLPFGVSVESVSIRQVEIDASVRLATRLQAELRR